ncbi:MAG: hypothetical protein WBP46_20690 [Thiolinea sp.]
MARSPQTIAAYCPQCREKMVCVGLVQPPPAKRIKDWLRWHEKLSVWASYAAINQVKTALSLKSKQHYYSEIVANRELNTLASRRRLRRAQKAYDEL